MADSKTLNFAIVGVAGFVAPRHLQAIHDTGHRLIAAVDPHDSVGILDSYAPGARFFTEIERFDRHLEKLRREAEAERLHYMSICSPNYLHDAHVRLALRLHAQAICEKPLVINPWNLDQLEALEEEYGSRVYTTLQLRYHPRLLALRERLDLAATYDVELTYVSRRGSWYHSSWKGEGGKSGGLAMNLGVHFFDFLLWLFGPLKRSALHLDEPSRMAGALQLERARVRWFLSVDESDLPREAREAGRTAHRSVTVDGDRLELSDGFQDLHTRVYEAILRGEGLGIADARPSIELVYAIRTAQVEPAGPDAHPLVRA